MTATDISPTTNDDISDTSKRDISPVKYRPATPADELHIITAFSRMLRELEPLGHDVLPTDANVDLFWERVFLPALASGRHGCVLAFAEGECVGACLATAEQTPVQTPPARAVLHALWVHPAHRQQGIGREMLRLTGDALLAAGFDRLMSGALRRNDAGLHTQLRAGAEIVAYVTCLNLKGAS